MMGNSSNKYSYFQMYKNYIFSHKQNAFNTKTKNSEISKWWATPQINKFTSKCTKKLINIHIFPETLQSFF